MARGPDKRKRAPRRGICPHPIWSIHEHVAWYGDEGGFDTHHVDEMTYTRPGSMQKVEIMRKRVERGEPLFHEDDGPVDLE